MNFQQGLSGLNASSKNLEVIGNNVANANTYGAKASRAEFADIYANSLSGTGTGNIGIGVRMQTVAQQFTQGSITATENPLDIAINGSGFFQVSDPSGARLYTRNGQFKMDREGYVVNNEGQNLMGYAATSDGSIVPKAASKLQLPTDGIDPVATTKIDMEMNLDARVTPVPTTTTFDMTNAKTYNNATSLTVYDKEGQAVPVTFYFKKIEASDANAGTNDQWEVYMSANGVQTPSDGTPLRTIEYSGGKPVNGPITVTQIIPQTTANGVTTEPITGLDGTGVTFDLSASTQWGASFSVTDLTQDGYTAGELSSLQVEDNGIVTARYTNGQTKSAGQIELATFRNPQGLQAMGGNVWAASYASGDPVVGTPNSGTMGLLQSGALEESNVDLTGELVNMITAQRVYQANAQTIKTQDSVLQTLVSLR
jgi:flagellar hook protein FlgE